ncbi:Vegetative incompatibility protein HET-E-1 [Symbiodinium microadriaticum]|uniref:Vegetative incompatibility protein HET-E-1 n=1 Tax=Symbiodinium microadriaticum TaxID=2951 RepID=A0A1Q9EEW3_SYMMI|nr:Vegetative incompatibility protein HET-E-1 [Symbiodinium microadriaticum]
MAGISTDRMRAEVRKLLAEVDLKSTSVGQLRASLETSLGLGPGALETQKDEVQRIFSSEISQLHAAESTEGGHGQKKEDTTQNIGGASKKADSHKRSDEKTLESALIGVHEACTCASRAGSGFRRKAKDAKDKKSKKEKDSKDDRKRAKVEEEAPHPPNAGLPSTSCRSAPNMKYPKEKEEEKGAAEEEEADGLEAEDVDVDIGKPAAAPIFDNWDPTPLPVPAFEPARASAMVLSGSEDGTVRLWDLELETKCIRVLEGHTGTVHSLTVNWETFEAVSGADDSSKLWNLKLGGCQKTMTEVPEGCTAVEADWTGRRALAGCGDGSLRVWSMTTADLQTTFPAHRGGVWALKADFKSNRLVSAGDENFKIWDVRDWTCVHTSSGHAGGLMCISVNWTKSQLLAGTGSSTKHLQLWNFAAESETTDPNVSKADLLQGHADVVADLAVDWTNGTAVTAGWDAQLITWNLEKKTQIQAHECKFGRVRSLAVDFKVQQALCGSSNGSLHLMDLHNGLTQRSLEGHGGAVTALNAQRMVV